MGGSIEQTTCDANLGFSQSLEHSQSLSLSLAFTTV